MRAMKKSGICVCGKKEWMFRSADRLASGLCNKCLRAAKRPVLLKDDRGNIYTNCTDCGKIYRYSRKGNGHRCR